MTTVNRETENGNAPERLPHTRHAPSTAPLFTFFSALTTLQSHRKGSSALQERPSDTAGKPLRHCGKARFAMRKRLFRITGKWIWKENMAQSADCQTHTQTAQNPRICSRRASRRQIHEYYGVVMYIYASRREDSRIFIHLAHGGAVLFLSYLDMADGAV